MHDDFEMEEALEDEEDVVIMGGDGFTPEQIAAAEARLNAQLVCPPTHCFAGKDTLHTKRIFEYRKGIPQNQCSQSCNGECAKCRGPNWGR